MNVEVEETGPVERKLRIQIPTAEVDAAFDGVYGGLRKGARIQGFRPGRVPRTVLERYYGEQARSQVLERLVQQSLPKAIQEAELAVLGDPRLHAHDPPQQGEPYAYEASFDVRPEIALERVAGLEVTKPELPDPEEEPVDRHLEELRLQQSQLVEELADTASARGHQAVVDYTAVIDGQSFEGGNGQEVVVELGEGRAIPGLEDELIGMQVGGERSFELELPESYPDEKAAGRTARFEVRLVGLKRRELPELDDEFAKDVSDFDTLAEFRADLEKRVATGRENEKQRLLRDAVVAAALEANPFPVPEALVERQLEHRISRAAGQLSQLPEEDLRRLVDGWREDWRPHAEREVRLALLVPVVAESEGLTVETEEVDQELAKLAEQSEQSLTQLKRSYREQGLLEALESSLLERRVVDFLLSGATVSGP